MPKKWGVRSPKRLQKREQASEWAGLVGNRFVGEGIRRLNFHRPR